MNCMCCGVEITDKNSSLDKELCKPCYDDVVVTEEEVEAIELSNDFE